MVLARFSRQLVSNGLLQPLQSGCRSNHSTETALLKLVNDLLWSADDGKVSVLALLALSSAFYATDHGVLLRRLHDTYGTEGTTGTGSIHISRTVPSLYLFCGRASRPHQLLYGVPQGSVLGLVLFTLYTLPLASVMSSEIIDTHVRSFALPLQPPPHPPLPSFTS